VPTAHGRHAAFASTVSWPWGHRHADAPAVENLSAAHGTQVSSLVAPVAMEYLPEAHGAQVSSLVASVAMEYLPAAHSTQVLA
jgi:hypothetical protein